VRKTVAVTIAAATMALTNVLKGRGPFGSPKSGARGVAVVQLDPDDLVAVRVL
jgi:hypothetical protein